MVYYMIDKLIERRKELGFRDIGSKSTVFYGIYLGKDPQTGIYVTGYIAYSWNECSYYTQNIGKNKKKKFRTFEEALYYATCGKTPF